MYSEGTICVKITNFVFEQKTFANIFAHILHVVVVDVLFSMFCSVDILLFYVLYVDW
jgi:hypothetical protein